MKGTTTRTCRMCGCTDADCSKCLARTGERCHWVDDDLCSACAPLVATHRMTCDIARQIADQLGAPGVMIVMLDPHGHLHIGAAAVDHPITANFVKLTAAVEDLADQDRDAIASKRTPRTPERAACIHCRKDIAGVDDIDAIRQHSMTCVESPIVHLNAEIKRQLAVASDAIDYTLTRSQTDPDFGYYCGPGTETFQRLVNAEAAFTGRDPKDIYKERAQDRQPAHRRREPDVVVLRDKLEEARHGRR